MMVPKPSSRGKKKKHSSQKLRKDHIMPREKGLRGIHEYVLEYKKLYFLKKKVARFNKRCNPQIG